MAIYGALTLILKISKTSHVNLRKKEKN
jgi:hypothetical protein